MTRTPLPSARREPWASVVAKLGRLVERQMQGALTEHDLSAGQFMALSHIADRPGVNRADLARALQVSPQAASGVIGQLAGKGLLERTPSQPGMPIALSLTREGRDLLGRAEPAVEALGRRLLLRCVTVDASAAVENAFRHVLHRLGGRQSSEAGRRDR